MKKAVVVLVLLSTAVAFAADSSRSIKRTHRAIVSCAFAMERAGSTEGMDRMRAAIVRNTAARLAAARGKEKTAMFLTLEGRRLARELLADYGEGKGNPGLDSDPDETAAAAGGGGKDAAAAIAEAEKRVPSVDELAKLHPDEVDAE